MSRIGRRGAALAKTDLTAEASLDQAQVYAFEIWHVDRLVPNIFISLSSEVLPDLGQRGEP